MSLTYTAPGWPRPVHGHWPIPWVTPVENLRQVDPDRMKEVVERGLCEVCGELPKQDEDVYLLVNLENGPIPQGMAEKVVQAMDNAVMHERCAALALSYCPQLRRLRASGDLVAYCAPWRRVRVYDCSDPFLGVDGEHVQRVDLADLLGGPG